LRQRSGDGTDEATKLAANRRRGGGCFRAATICDCAIRIGHHAEICPPANLTSLDPIWTTSAVTENHAYAVYDTLYAVNSKLEPKPQMADGHSVSEDGRTYLIKLRDGLKFHNGEPVRAQAARPVSPVGWRATRWGKRSRPSSISGTSRTTAPSRSR
jgi:hypothetical protein